MPPKIGFKKFKKGQRVIYTSPVQGRRYDVVRDKPATVVLEYEERVRLSIEMRPGVFVEKVVFSSSVRKA